MTTGATEDSWSIYYENAEKGEKRDGSQLSEVYKRTILPFRDPFGWRGVRLPFASLKARESSPNLNAEREHKCNVAMPRCRAHSIVLMAHGSWLMAELTRPDCNPWEKGVEEEWTPE